MIVITYATEIDGYLPILILQCDKLKLKLKIIGQDKNGKGFSKNT